MSINRNEWGTLYTVVDRPPDEVLKLAGVNVKRREAHAGDVLPSEWKGRIMARWTGEKRPPKAGEYFLSGAIIEAYRAPLDLKAPYHIAELVQVKQTLVTTIVRVLR